MHGSGRSCAPEELRNEPRSCGAAERSVVLTTVTSAALVNDVKTCTFDLQRKIEIDLTKLRLGQGSSLIEIPSAPSPLSPH